jgi:hypothetical protein
MDQFSMAPSDIGCLLRWFPKTMRLWESLDLSLLWISRIPKPRGFRKTTLSYIRFESVVISISSSSKILPKTSEVALSNLSKSGGTNLHLLHVVLLQCIGKTLVAVNGLEMEELQRRNTEQCIFLWQQSEGGTHSGWCISGGTMSLARKGTVARKKIH